MRRLQVGIACVVVAAALLHEENAAIAEPPAPAAKLEHSTTVRVTDGHDHPVVGAVITSNDFPASWNSPAKTDEKGVAKVPWPHYSPGFSANVSIDHPDFIFEQGRIVIGAELFPIQLRRPSVVQLMARLPGEEGACRDLIPDFGSQKGVGWTEDEGLLTIGRLDLTHDGPKYVMRLMHLSEQGSCFFSDSIDLRRIPEGVHPPTIPLRQGREFRGRLSADVPRPVVGGVVYAVSRSPSNVFSPTPWSRVVAIGSNGDFLIDSLPPGANVELLVLCKGWMSAPPMADEMRTAEELYSKGDVQSSELLMGAVFRSHQVTGDRRIIDIEMERTSPARVRVVDPQGQPVAGANVRASTFQRLAGASSSPFGSAIDSVVALRARAAGVSTPPASTEGKVFEGVTDVDGFANLEDIPRSVYRGKRSVVIRMEASHRDWKPASLNAVQYKEPVEFTLTFKARSEPSGN